jgi:hypothetical protein
MQTENLNAPTILLRCRGLSAALDEGTLIREGSDIQIGR